MLHTGSGAIDRDSTFFHHKPFKNMAEYFAKNGIAVLRYDKRGIGKSTGNFSSSSIKDFEQDLLDAVDFLKTQKVVDPKKIGLLGHSEGGLVAVMASNKSKEIAFVITMAGPAMPIKHNGALLFSFLVNENNNDTEQLEKDRVIFRRFFDIATKKKQSKEEQKEAVEIAKKMLPRISEKSKIPLGLTNIDPELFTKIFTMVPCIQDFINSDPETYIKNINIPFLAIYGSNDVQVPPKENIKILKKILENGKTKDFTIKIIQGYNHLFQKCYTGFPSEYLLDCSPMNEEVLEIIKKWIYEQL